MLSVFWFVLFFGALAPPTAAARPECYCAERDLDEPKLELSLTRPRRPARNP